MIDNSSVFTQLTLIFQILAQLCLPSVSLLCDVTEPDIFPEAYYSLNFTFILYIKVTLTALLTSVLST